MPQPSLPSADEWADAAQEATACVAERSPSGYLASFSSLLAATAGGDGASLVGNC